MKPQYLNILRIPKCQKRGESLIIVIFISLCLFWVETIVEIKVKQNLMRGIISFKNENAVEKKIKHL